MKKKRVHVWLYSLLLTSFSICLYSGVEDYPTVTLKVPVHLRNMLPGVHTVSVYARLFADDGEEVGSMLTQLPTVDMPADGQLQHIFEITVYEDMMNVDRHITEATSYVCTLYLNDRPANAGSQNDIYQCKSGTQCVKEIRGQIQW